MACFNDFRRVLAKEIMTTDILLAILLTIITIVIIVLTLPIWICYTICKRIDLHIIKDIYYLWWEK